MKHLRLILGDQLNASHSWYKTVDNNTVYLICELHQEASYVTHHIQKIAAFFKAMESFATALSKAGHQVIYLTLDDTAQYRDLPHLLETIIQQQQISQFSYQQPDEYRLAQQLAAFSKQLAIASTCVDSEHFYLAHSELSSYFKTNTKHRLEHFYRAMRRRFNLLMDGEEPHGGQWNFDTNNRSKLKAKDLAQVPQPLLFETDVTEILERINRHQITTIGRIESHLLWPVTRASAKALLIYFCQYCLPQFGQFQDAMTGRLGSFTFDNGWSLYHSRLSFALNSKILSPQQVVNTAINAYHDSNGDISIAQIEGFIRQILGWREFVRGIYWLNMPTYRQLNALDAKRALPSWFWNGNTTMRCQQQAISQSLDYSYAHHIQRLMVTGNFCLLTGIAPDEVDNWYLGIYIDAIEWVELPNTRGMSQFADGGIVGSKAYAASGNYINKMSDYCQDCHYDVKQITSDNACPLNALYWHFMLQHQAQFANSPRNSMVYTNWRKRSPTVQEEILVKAQHLLANLEQL